MTESELLLKNVRNKGELTPSEEEEFLACFKRTIIKKKQFIVQPEFVAKYRTYIVKGAFRGYVIGDEGEEHTISFAIDDWWTSDIDSFVNQKPSTMFVVALEDSTVLQIDYKKEEELKVSNPKFERLFRIQAEKGMAFLQKRLIANLTQTAEERYEHFLQNYSPFVNRVPQYALASFLNMTTEYLSRIRNKRVQTKS